MIKFRIHRLNKQENTSVVTNKVQHLCFLCMGKYKNFYIVLYKSSASELSVVLKIFPETKP